MTSSYEGRPARGVISGSFDDTAALSTPEAGVIKMLCDDTRAPSVNTLKTRIILITVNYCITGCRFLLYL